MDASSEPNLRGKVNKKYFAIITVFCIVILGLIVAIIVVVLTKHNITNSNDAPTADSCEIGSELFNEYISAHKIPDICLNADTRTECFNGSYRFVNSIIKKAESMPKFKNSLLAFLVGFCINNNQTERGLELSKSVIDDLLSIEEKYYYYGYLSSAYYENGFLEEGDRYLLMSMENVPDEIRNDSSGG